MVAQHRVPDLSRRVQLRPGKIQPPQPMQHRTQLWRLAHLLTQRRPGCRRAPPRVLPALSLFRCCPEGDVEGQGLLGMLRRLWQGLQQLNPGGAVADSFHIGRAVTGLLARPQPVRIACSWQPAAV